MAVNLTDYSRTAAQRGWGAGWPSCRGVKTAGTAIVTADRSGTRFSVHKRIARLVDLLVDETERRGYLLIKGQCGGYNCRAIGGTSTASNHSWGLAWDMNWLRNPMRKPLTTDIPRGVIDLWARYGFAWGGHYGDPMHLEFMGTPADADAMTALAVRELLGQAPAAPPKVTTPSPRPPESSRPTLRRGANGSAVRELQTVLARWYPVLRLRPDGDFGPATEAAVRHLQRNARLVVDGVAGPATYRVLGM